MIITTNIVPNGFDAITIWPFIFIRSTHYQNEALIAHETIHYNEQKWKTPVWWWKYLFNKEFRLQAEVRAYKKQLEYKTVSVDYCAGMLVKYGCNITLVQARDLLVN